MPRIVRSFLILLGVIAAGIGAYRAFGGGPALDAREIRQQIYTAVVSEATESFLVTGRLEVNTTLVVNDTRVLFPDLLDFSLGTTRATMRVPGVVSYGFDIRELEPEMIHVTEDLVEIELPMLRVYSAEPDLAKMEVETDIGWARLPASARAAERTAMNQLGDALRRQGEAHLESSAQPRINTARALEVMVTPVLRATGTADPQIRFLLGEGLLLEGGA
jgi:hypothetical protein